MIALNIVYGNIQSYANKKHLLNYYLEQNNVNICLMVETKVHMGKEITFRDWSCIQNSGYQLTNYPRGGAAALLHPSIKVGKQNCPKLNNNLNDCLHFTVQIDDLDEKLHIFLTYIHPFSKLEENIFIKASLYKYAIIIGDFNLNKSKNKHLNFFLSHSNFVHYKTNPTFIMPGNKDTTPDVFLLSSNLLGFVDKVDLFPDLGSDHLSFYISINFPNSNYINNNLSCNKINFNKCNISNVNRDMLNFIEIHSEVNNINTELFIDTLTTSVKNHSPTSSDRNTFYAHTLPPFIVNLIKRKRLLYREYVLNGNSELKAYINKFSKNIKLLITQYRASKWLTTCDCINQTSGKVFWSKIKTMCKYKKSPTIPALCNDGVEYEPNHDKANLFADYFNKCYKRSDYPFFDRENFDRVNRACDDLETQPFFNIPQIEVEEYSIALCSGKNTAPGYDLVTKRLLRLFDTKLHEYIRKMFNYCLNHQYFPPQWKLGIIIVFAKPNLDSKLASSYRPITLLPTLGKVLEKIIKKRLFDALSACIPATQFGFTPFNSTVHPLFLLTNNVQNSRSRGLKSCAVFLDVKKAFDSVWHNGILFKLKENGCPSYLIQLVREFLEGRMLKVRIGTDFSYHFTPEQGVPQGSPLSPLLYILFSCDLPIVYSLNQYTLQYADDTAIVVHENTINKAISSIQRLINMIVRWFSEWRIQINASKTQFIIFHHRIKPTSPSIIVDNVSTAPQPSVKYLGVEIDSSVSFKNHAKLVKQKLNKRAKYFRLLSYQNDGLCLKNRSKIYKSICRPLLDYAAPIFSSCQPPFWRTWAIAERAALRTITRIRHPFNHLFNPHNSLLYTMCEVMPITDRQQEFAKKFHKRIKNQPSFINLLQFPDAPDTNPKHHSIFLY